MKLVSGGNRAEVINNHDGPYMVLQESGDIILMEDYNDNIHQFMKDEGILKRSLEYYPVDYDVQGDVYTGKIQTLERTIVPSIDLEYKKYICTCEAFLFRNSFCKHLIALVLSLDERVNSMELSPEVGDG